MSTYSKDSVEQNLGEKALTPQVQMEHYEASGTNATKVDKTESELFDVYQRVSETQPGTSDAEIFEKIHEWTFSDYSIPAYEFAGISREELLAWQQRNRINLSMGHIRPAAIDLERAYAWGHIRMAATANRYHSSLGPPSAEEILAEKKLYAA